MGTSTKSVTSRCLRSAFATLAIGVAAATWAEHDSMERIDVWETNRVETGMIDSGYLDLRGGVWTQAGGSTYFNVQAAIGLGAEIAFGNKIRKQELNVTGGEFICRRLVAGLANDWTYPAEVNVTAGTLKSHYDPKSGSTDWGAYGFSLASRSYGNAAMPTDWANASPAARLTVDGGQVSFPAFAFGSLWRHADDTGNALKSSAQVRLRGGVLELGGGGVRINYWDDDRSYYDFNLSGGTLKLTSSANVSVRTHLSPANGGATIEVPAGASSVMKSEIFGSGSLRKMGAGTLALANFGAYTGRTEVAEGALYVKDPSNDATWTGDCFANTASGTQVTSWTNARGKGTWSFTYNGTLVDSAYGPSVSATPLNGHPTLAFDGRSSLFLTGNVTQPASGSSELTMVVVVKIPSGTVGADSADWITATMIAGTSINQVGLLRYGFALDARGKVGFGTSFAQQPLPLTETLWSDAAINDGRAHVVIGTWQQGAGYSLTVDGVRKTIWSTQIKTSLTGQTRFILGGSELQKTSLFSGELAELRLIPRVYAKGEVEMLTERLRKRYGLATDPAPVTVPTPTAVWSADDLRGEAGSAVTSWQVGSWNFSSTLADTILSSCSGYVSGTAPTIAADKVNGHKLVSFNGTSDALALTGNAATPVSGADGMSLAFAVRFSRLGRGAPYANIDQLSLFFGEGCLTDVDTSAQVFGLGYSGSGMAHAGHYCHRIDGTTTDGYGVTRSRQAFLDDGEVHVIVATWPKIADDVDYIHLSVDGEETTSPAKMRNGILKSRILLGASEWKLSNVARYVPVDVAEFRIYKDTVLTSDQIQRLTSEMAAKYGTLTVRDRAKTGEFSRSKEVLVQAGATYGAQNANECFEVSADQIVDCRGTLRGRPVVRTDGTLMTGAVAALAVNGLELEDGAVLCVRASEDGTIQPIAVAGDVRLPNGTVKVVVSGCGGKVPSGDILTWTGNLVKSGTTQFEVVGRRRTVRLDETGKRLELQVKGLFLIVR